MVAWYIGTKFYYAKGYFHYVKVEPLGQKKKCLFPIPWQKKFESVGRIEILFYFEILFFRGPVVTPDDEVNAGDSVADLSNACPINKRPFFHKN